MTKCITALGNVPGNSILVYMRVPAATSDLHISEGELNAAFFICFFYLSGWVWWCELLNSYLSGWVWWCELLDMLNLPKPIVSFLYALFAQPQGFWSGCTMLERLCILLGDQKL